ncbi:MAG: flagellar motor protein MotB [Pseudomonadales bacterium]|nr:flagellar motor protein MotB [Pseudomonadales bacterium]
MAEEEEECPACPDGIPAWVMTFADLMSLLMCFFVLLLSFSEMDLQKYKRLAGSMSEAFGVQNQINVKDIPKGTSIIAQEFSPGRPKPTPLNEVKQSTTSVTQQSLDTNCPEGSQPESDKEGDLGSEAAEAKEGTPGGSDGKDTDSAAAAAAAEAASEAADAEAMAMLAAMGQLELQTQQNAMEVASALNNEINSGQVEIETDGNKIVIRIKEHGSFSSGTARMHKAFEPIMKRMREILSQMPGVFTVEGHTDNIPIKTSQFRSNWELSAARAVTVAHELMAEEQIDPRKFTVVGYGDTRPLAPNLSKQGRSRNRRVEIIIRQSGDEKDDELPVFEPGEVDKVVEEIEQREAPALFEFAPDEIF